MKTLNAAEDLESCAASSELSACFVERSIIDTSIVIILTSLASYPHVCKTSCNVSH